METLSSKKAPLEMRIKDIIKSMNERVDRWQDMAYFTRKLMGCTQEEFAERISVSRVTVEYWETGRTVASVRSRAKMYWECILFCKMVCGECIDDELKSILKEYGMKICTLTKK